MPTETQWNWAYKGGEKSLKYTYSGSNVATEVGWNKDNSGGKAHKVATLMPNELGIYDMYGNLGEWFKKGTGSQPYSYQISNFSNTTMSHQLGSSGTSTNTGIRIILSF